LTISALVGIDGGAAGGEDEVLYVPQLKERLKTVALLEELAKLLADIQALRAEIHTDVSRLTHQPADTDVVEIHRMLAEAIEIDLGTKSNDHTQIDGNRLRAFRRENDTSARTLMGQTAALVHKESCGSAMPPPASRRDRLALRSHQVSTRRSAYSSRIRGWLVVPPLRSEIS
jgi:hypothetical protein